MTTSAATAATPPSRTLAALAPGQHGFTLIELLVAMSLFLIVGTLVTRTLLDVVGYQDKATSTRTASANAVNLLDQLGNDLRSAISPTRLDLTEAPGRHEDLQNLLLFNVQPREGATVTPSDLDDVTYASSTQLWFRADVMPAAGAPASECVAYVSSAEGIYREVRSDWRACTPGSGGVVMRQRMVEANPSGATDVFRYVRMTNPSANSAQTVNQGLVRVSQCERVDDVLGPLTITQRELREVVAVNVDLASYSGKANPGKLHLQSTVNVRSRLTNIYLFSVGCTEWV